MRFILIFVIIFHMFIIMANVACIGFLPFFSPWYIALPIITLLINLLYSPTQCPLTKLENKLRRLVGIREIRFFVGHYFIWPVRKFLRKRKSK